MMMAPPDQRMLIAWAEPRSARAAGLHLPSRLDHERHALAERVVRSSWRSRIATPHLRAHVFTRAQRRIDARAHQAIEIERELAGAIAAARTSAGIPRRRAAQGKL